MERAENRQGASNEHADSQAKRHTESLQSFHLVVLGFSGDGSTPGMLPADEIQRLEKTMKTMKCENKGDVLGDNSFP